MHTKKIWPVGVVFFLIFASGACSDENKMIDSGLINDGGTQHDLRVDQRHDGKQDSSGRDLSSDMRKDIPTPDMTQKPHDLGRPDLRIPETSPPDLTAPDLTAPDLPPTDLPSPDAPNIVVLSNGLCGSTTMGPMAPDVGEDGVLAASRLTPKHYPFTVTQIRYALLPGSSLTCHTGMAHRIDLYVGSGVAPLASPTVLRSINVVARSPGTTIRVITLDVTPPLILTQGEQLFVAIEMRINANKNRTCLRSCFPASVAPDRDYWSNAASAPYPWKTLKALGIPAVYSTQALGY